MSSSVTSTKVAVDMAPVRSRWIGFRKSGPWVWGQGESQSTIPNSTPSQFPT